MIRKLLKVLFLASIPWSGAANAVDQTLDFQAVMHTTEVHALPVPGQPDRKVGIAAFRGLAIFRDGRVAQHWYSGSFDFVKGSGKFHGYALWTFDDGSRLEAAYAGEANTAADGGITFTGTYSNLVGKGRYADVRGDGTFSGRRVDRLNDGGDTYLRGALTIKSGAK